MFFISAHLTPWKACCTTPCKAVTGQSGINCRFMRENNFTFMPTHKPVLMTNARPRISVDDNALLRRLIIVPFSNVYKHPDEFDADDPTHRPIELGLGDRLTSRECQEQFVTWLVRGAVAVMGDYYCSMHRDCLFNPMRSVGRLL